LCAHLHHYCEADFLAILKAKGRFTKSVKLVRGGRWSRYRPRSPVYFWLNKASRGRLFSSRITFKLSYLSLFVSIPVIYYHVGLQRHYHYVRQISHRPIQKVTDWLMNNIDVRSMLCKTLQDMTQQILKLMMQCFSPLTCCWPTFPSTYRRQ